MLDLFRDLEARLLRPEFRRSSADVESLLAFDFVEFGSSGAIYDRQQTVKGLAYETTAERSMQDFSVRALSNEVTLVTYRAVRRDPISGQERHSLRSSIWQLIDGRWQMIFHQGTQTSSALSGA